MMSIGEFAALTGLTIRALRFYDEEGVLVPAEVDESSRYRRYSADQLEAGVKLSMLRRAELPLREAVRVLDGTGFAEVIASYRSHLEEERNRQDKLLADLDVTVTLEVQSAGRPEAISPVKVEVRETEPCDWAGIAFRCRRDLFPVNDTSSRRLLRHGERRHKLIRN